MRQGETFRFAPVSCGVQATFSRRGGDALAYSVFFRERPAPRDGGLVDSTTAVQTSPRATVRLRTGYASGIDGHLVRAELRFPPGRSPVRVTICNA